ncbi:MAG: hypothetical protein ACOCUT_03445 [bacterium]
MNKTLIGHCLTVISFMPSGALVGYYLDSFLIGVAVFSFGVGILNVGWFIINELKN